MKTSQKPETIRQHLTVIKEELSVNFEESSANHSESSLKYYLSWGVLISFIHRLQKESIITDWVGVEGGGVFVGTSCSLLCMFCQFEFSTIVLDPLVSRKTNKIVGCKNKQLAEIT